MNGTGEGGKGQKRKWIKEICEWGRGKEFHDHRRPLHPKINWFIEREKQIERKIIWNIIWILSRR